MNPDNFYMLDSGYFTDENVYYVLYSKLHEYDIAQQNGEKIDFNPYVDTIIISSPSDNDVSYEVPKAKQQLAVSKWTEIKNNPNSESEEENKINNVNSDDNLTDSTFQFILCALIIFVILHTFRNVFINR